MRTVLIILVAGILSFVGVISVDMEIEGQWVLCCNEHQPKSCDYITFMDTLEILPNKKFNVFGKHTKVLGGKWKMKNDVLRLVGHMSSRDNPFKSRKYKEELNIAYLTGDSLSFMCRGETYIFKKVFGLIHNSKAQTPHSPLFHSYTRTASSWNIISWNIDPANHKYVVRETIDMEGRVTQLEFMEDDVLSADPLCYLANRVTFEYPKNQIVETLYHGNEELLGNECEMYYKTVYHLNSQSDINKAEYYSKIDTTEMSDYEIEQWRKWVPEYNLVSGDSTIIQVEYYYHSYAKMAGAYPTSMNYELDTNHYYYGDEPEKSSILNGLKN